jgi:hypothetical protein
MAREPGIRVPADQLPWIHRLREAFSQCGRQGVGGQDARRPGGRRALGDRCRVRRPYARGDLRCVIRWVRRAGGGDLHARPVLLRGGTSGPAT